MCQGTFHGISITFDLCHNWQVEEAMKEGALNAQQSTEALGGEMKAMQSAAEKESAQILKMRQAANAAKVVHAAAAAALANSADQVAQLTALVKQQADTNTDTIQQAAQNGAATEAEGLDAARSSSADPQEMKVANLSARIAETKSIQVTAELRAQREVKQAAALAKETSATVADHALKAVKKQASLEQEITRTQRELVTVEDDEATAKTNGQPHCTLTNSAYR